MESSTPPKKKRVGFTPEEPAAVVQKNRPNNIILPNRSTLSPSAGSPTFASPTESIFGHHSRDGSTDALIPPIDPERAHLPQVSSEITDQIRAALTSVPSRPRPALRRGDSANSMTLEKPDLSTVQDVRAREAHERGKRLERDERVKSAPTSRRASPSARARPRFQTEDIPLEEFGVHSDAEGKSLEKPCDLS